MIFILGIIAGVLLSTLAWMATITYRLWKWKVFQKKDKPYKEAIDAINKQHEAVLRRAKYLVAEGFYDEVFVLVKESDRLSAEFIKLMAERPKVPKV